MHFVRYVTEDGAELKVPLYEDQIFTECVECGTEIFLQQDELMHMLICGGDLAGTTTTCGACNAKKSEEGST